MALQPEQVEALPADVEPIVSSDSAPSSPELASTPSEGSVPTPGSPIVPISVADSFAFAFDIDGVLVRGGKPIPEAIEAMKVLNGGNEYGIQIPHIFLTNGGGKFEEERCQDLSKQLERPIQPGQFICGHTPMREMASRYETVLIVGGEGEKCKQVAEGYGFKTVLTPGDIIRHDAATTPFRQLEVITSSSPTRDLTGVTVDAVFVFADSRDWGSDIQIMLDLAMSVGGRLGTRSETFTEGPPFYFSHNDVVWSAAHEHVRIGMGALRRMFEVTFEDITHGTGKLRTHAFGKPQVSTFEFASRLMSQWRYDQHGLTEAPKTVYFIGDTPESDICGANAVDAKADNEWFSILVKTGVYQDGTEPAYKPRATVNDVLEAVNLGIQREMRKKVASGLKEKVLDGEAELAGGMLPA
ncbi:hypothetical protein CP532_1614 [Ophiocordyceps camponoti-leonardi (nom. inval.)]|nr:hypothetical protein CP532_1614 [Ophiocordyceps camponoti-leonardi (nom. inval.)]